MAYEKQTWQNDSAPYINNDNLNHIEEGIYDASVGVENMGAYSTTETVIGTWVDGKPIYRKVVQLTSTSLSSSKWLYIDVSNDNIETIIDVKGTVNLTSTLGTKNQLIQRTVTDAITTYGIGLGDMNSTQIGIQFGTSYTQLNSGYLIYEYTKTTD